MSYTDILYSVDDFVATITLNRPDKLNAWTSEMDADLHHAIERAAADDAVRAIVITGAGRGFCAGADMSRLSRLSAGETPRAIVGADGGKPGNFEQKFGSCSPCRSRSSLPSTVRSPASPSASSYFAIFATWRRAPN